MFKKQCNHILILLFLLLFLLLLLLLLFIYLFVSNEYVSGLKELNEVGSHSNFPISFDLLK